MGVEVGADRLRQLPPVRAYDEAELDVRVGRARNRADRLGGVPRGQGEDFEGVPGEDTLGRGEARLAPVRVDRGVVLAAADREVREGRLDRLGDRGRS